VNKGGHCRLMLRLCFSW